MADEFRRNDYETIHDGRHHSSQSHSPKKGGKKQRVKRKTTPLKSESHENMLKISMNPLQNSEKSMLIQPSKLESEPETGVSRKRFKTDNKILNTSVSERRQTLSEPRDNPTSQQEPEIVVGRDRTKVPSILELDRTTQMWTDIEKNRNQGMLIGVSIQSLSQTDLNSLIPHCADVATDMEVYMHSTYIDHRIVKKGSIFLSLYHHLDFMKIFQFMTQVELESIYITVGLKRLEICPPVDIVMNLNMKHCNTARSRWRYDVNSGVTHEIGLIDVPGGVPLTTLLALFPKAFVLFSSSEQVDYSFQLDDFTPSSDVTEEGCELRICFCGPKGIEQFPRLYHRIVINDQKVRISYSGPFRYRLPCQSPTKDVPLCLPAGLEFGERDTLMGSPSLSLKYPAVAATRLVEQIRLKREREKQFRRENLDFKEFSPNCETNKQYCDKKSKEKFVLKRPTSSCDSDPKTNDLLQGERVAPKKKNVNPETKSNFSLQTGQSNLTSSLEFGEDLEMTSQARTDTANSCQSSGISKTSSICDTDILNTDINVCSANEEVSSVKKSLASLRKHSNNSSQTMDRHRRKQNDTTTKTTEDFDDKDEEAAESETDLSSDSESPRSKSKEKDAGCLNVVQFNEESEMKKTERLSDKDIISKSFSHSQTLKEHHLLDWNQRNSNVKLSHSSDAKSEISGKEKSKRPKVPKTQNEEINKTEKEMNELLVLNSDSGDNYKTCNKKSGVQVGKTEKKKKRETCESVIKSDASEGKDSSVYDASEGKDSSVYDASEGKDSSVYDASEGKDSSVYDASEGKDSSVYDASEGKDSGAYDASEGKDSSVDDASEGKDSSVYDASEEKDSGAYDASEGKDSSVDDASEGKDSSVDDASEGKDSGAYDASEGKDSSVYDASEGNDSSAYDASCESHSRIVKQGKDDIKEENEDMGVRSSDSNNGQIPTSITSGLSQKNSNSFVQVVNDQERRKEEQFNAGSNYDNGNSSQKNPLRKDKATPIQIVFKGKNMKQVGEDSRNVDDSSNRLLKKVNADNNNKTTNKSAAHHGKDRDQSNFMMEEEEKKKDVSSGIRKDNYEDVKEIRLEQELETCDQRVKDKQPDNNPVPSQHFDILHSDENQISSQMAGQMAGKAQTNEKCSRLKTVPVLNKPDSPCQVQSKDFDKYMFKAIAKNEDVLDKFDPSNQGLHAVSQTIGDSNTGSSGTNFSSQVKTEFFPKRKLEFNKLSQVKYPKTTNSSSIPETQNSDSGLSSPTPKIETTQVTVDVKSDDSSLRTNTLRRVGNIVYFDHVKNEKKPTQLETSPRKEPAQKDLSESVNTNTMKVFKIESLPLSGPHKSQHGQRSLSTDNEPHYPISIHISPCHRPNLNKLHQKVPQQEFPLAGRGTFDTMTGTSSRAMNAMGDAGGQMSSSGEHVQQSLDNSHSNCNPSFALPMKMDMSSNQQWLQTNTDIPPCQPGTSTDRLCVKKEEKDNLSQFQIFKQSLVSYTSSASSDSDDLDSCMDDMDPSESLKKNLSSLKSLKRVKKSSSRSPKGSRFQSKVMKALARNYGLSDPSAISPSVLGSFESKNQ